MSFPFNITKATEVAAAFLTKSAGKINIMKLVKLIYIVDRQSFDRRGIPVVGGWYISMRNGPVTSEVLDLINAGSLGPKDDDTWKRHIGARREHTVTLLKPISPRLVSSVEYKMIEAVWRQHGDKDQWELRDWCHANCPEWSEISGGYQAIELGRLTEALGKTPEQYQHIASEAKELTMLGEIFSK